MKKILFDFITLQDKIINGGMLYTQKIFYNLLNNETQIYGLYDDDISINERVKVIAEKHKITLINIRDKNLPVIIEKLQINVIFLGIAQRYNEFNLCGLKCKIVIVCHDLFDKSCEYFDIINSKPLKELSKKYSTKKKKSIIKYLLFPLARLKYFIRNKKINLTSNYINFIKLIQQSNVFVITDSEYSKYSIQYFFGKPKNDIKVFYAPIIEERFVAATNSNLENVKNKKYFLLLSVNRPNKNVALFLEQWEKLCIETNNEYYCIFIGKTILNVKNCITFEKVNSEDITYLYKNAFAFVYPSFVEGFGYPPIEAALHGTPSICSNVTSIPEICGDMPIYFSPFYPEDLYRAMIKMTKNREKYVEKTKIRFLEVKQRQKEDLQKLIDFILL